MIRIPRRVVFPFGYHIIVRQVTDSDMDRRDPNADGIWDNDTKTIYIRKRLPVTRRRYILAHELGHAWLDWQHRHLDNGKARTYPVPLMESSAPCILGLKKGQLVGVFHSMSDSNGTIRLDGRTDFVIF